MEISNESLAERLAFCIAKDSRIVVDAVVGDDREDVLATVIKDALPFVLDKDIPKALL